MSKLNNLLGDILTDARGDSQPTVQVLKNKSIIGLYFSASYCPPCREFTPILAARYEEINNLTDQFEIILIPSDKTQELFLEYFATQPWYTTTREHAHLLRSICEVKTIPALIFIDADAKYIISTGRALVRDNSASDILSALTMW